MRYHTSYKFTYYYLLPFFFLSLYQYLNGQAIPSLRRLQYEVNILYTNNNFAFLKNLGLIVLTFCRMPSHCLRSRRLPIYQWRSLFQMTKQNQFFNPYLKFLTMSVARLKKNPFSNKLQSNANYMYTIPNYYTLESHYFELNIYDQIFVGFCVIRFVLAKTQKNLGLEYHNFLRMLNFPLARSLSF